MKRWIPELVVATVVAFAMVGCGTSPTRTTGVAPSALTGGRWVLDTTYAAGRPHPVPGRISASITFDEAGGVTVDDGMNTGSGRVRITGDRLVFGDLAWTLIGCARGTCTPPGFDDVVTGTAAFRLTGSRLMLTRGAIGLGFHRADRPVP